MAEPMPLDASARAEDDLGGAESVSETVGKVFAGYQCSTMQRGIDHPGDIAEAASLSSISLPPATYPIHDAIADDIVDGGKLSKLQLEGVAYACQKHCELLPDGSRAGFMIGDGAGVGKGRQISGIILDNYSRGRRRHLWVSSSADLHRDAERDLRDMGCHLKVINSCQELDREGSRALGLPKDFKEGVLFLTYSTLVSRTAKMSRLDQIVEWFGGAAADGCILLDECHKAKNFNAGNDTGSKVAGCVIELQRRCPDARVVYCSATGISEINNMAYMQRLGFWGSGTPFADADRFITMLTLEMKASGKYVSRSLSYRQAEFTTFEAVLTGEQVGVYNAAAEFMATLKSCLSQALVETRSPGGGPKGQAWKAYWSLHQRFFKLLCVSMKVPVVVQQARKALADGHCVVLGLQTTGESAESGLELSSGMRVDDFVSTTREMLLQFLRTHFPVHITDVAAANENNTPVAIIDGVAYYANPAEGGNGVSGAPQQPLGELREHEACMQARNLLMARAEALTLPPNFLDELIDKLGGKQAVAEMTGRRGRIVRMAGGKLAYEARGDARAASGRSSAGSIASDGDVEGVNLQEKAAFNRGDKHVAIISDAASTGISLHALKGAGNQRRRVHITIELPWSADKAIQQLGRTHRSNQTSGPLYVMCSTNLGGERRFAAAVARRLQSLGALTRGDRRAATGIDLSEGNLDSPLGRRALKKMYDALIIDGTPLPNGVTLAGVVAHLPASRKMGETEGTMIDHEGSEAAEEEVKEAGEEVEQAGWQGGRGKRKTAAGLLRLEAEQPGAGVIELHSELRNLLVSLGVQVGLSPEGLSDANVASLMETGAGAKDVGDVRKFLNRILGLPVRGQNLLFGYFTEVMEAEVKAAKAEGKYSEGVSDLSGSNIRIESTKVVARDPYGSGADLKQTRVLTDRGVSFDVATEILKAQRRVPKDGFYHMRHMMYGRKQVILALAKPGARNTFNITRPNTGASFFEMDVEELQQKYVKFSDENIDAARAPWEATYELTENACMHGAACQRGAACNAGSRAVRCCILSGAVVPAWGVLERVLERHEHRFNKSDRGMRAVKVVAEDGTKVVGIRYPEDLLPEVKERIQQEWAAAEAEKMMKAAEAKAGAGVVSRGGYGSQVEGGLLSPGRSRVRVEDPTPVNAQCAAKARRAPKTMMSFFKKKGDADVSLTENDGRGGGEKRASTGGSRGGVSMKKPKANPLGFAKAPTQRTTTTIDLTGRAPVECQTCPICNFAFPRTALNSEVNAHIDKCIANAV